MPGLRDIGSGFTPKSGRSTNDDSKATAKQSVGEFSGRSATAEEAGNSMFSESSTSLLKQQKERDVSVYTENSELSADENIKYKSLLDMKNDLKNVTEKFWKSGLPDALRKIAKKELTIEDSGLTEVVYGDEILIPVEDEDGVDWSTIAKKLNKLADIQEKDLEKIGVVESSEQYKTQMKEIRKKMQEKIKEEQKPVVDKESEPQELVVSPPFKTLLTELKKEIKAIFEGFYEWRGEIPDKQKKRYGALGQLEDKDKKSAFIQYDKLLSSLKGNELFLADKKSSSMIDGDIREAKLKRDNDNKDLYEGGLDDSIDRPNEDESQQVDE